jgi:membrane dipeptidase
MLRRLKFSCGFVVLLAACDAGPRATDSQDTTAAAEPKADESRSTAKSGTKDGPPKQDLAAAADALAHEVIILDGHVDVPYRIEKSKAADGSITEDVTGPTETGDFDYPRARKGGLDAPFMSIYVPAKYEDGGAKEVADSLIDIVEGFAERAPEKFALARSPADVRSNFASGRISLPLGMENGSPIESDLANVAHFHERGIRYITLAHSKDNHISDSSYDDRHTHKGLSEFGKKVVVEMNRTGIMVDVAHISDDAFWQVMEISKAPVIASHSSCRHFTPGFERNMSDEMITSLAEHGGVIQINFGSTFIDAEAREQNSKRWRELDKLVKESGHPEDSPEARALKKEYRAAHPAKVSSVEKVADHIEHVVEIAGIEHVGLGSDFDGVGDSLPTGLKDVSAYPNLIRVLLERGHSRSDVEKICSGNVLRVWEAVETHAARHSG